VKEEGLELNGTHQLTASAADDVTLLSGTKNIEAFLDTSKAVRLNVHIKKTMYVTEFRHQIIGNVANESFENVAKFKCLGRVLTSQKCIHEKIK
jgi:hypothetical protein